MIENLISSPLSFLASLLAIAIAISIHEFSHALAADRLGDPTPRLQKRLTLNPLAHLDPIGTLMLILFRFGWGKPVQFDQFNLRNPRRDTMLISLAGPASNLIKRVYEHKNKLVEGFTQRYNVIDLLHYEIYETPIEAIEREKQIKSWSRKKKDGLINSSNPILKDLSEEIASW